MRIRAIAIACVLAIPLYGADDTLVRLCDVWSTVKFLDPQLMVRDVDWDGALIRAIPKVREARTREDFAAAVDSMLGELHDPVTRVIHESDRAKPRLFDWDGDALIVNIGPYADGVSDERLFTVEGEIAPELAKAKSVVFDLRTHAADTPGWILENLPLVREGVAVPARRHVFHSGYAPQSGSSSGGYYSAMQVVASPAIEPADANTSTPSRIVFIVGNDIPDRAAALWWSGAAAIVATRPLSGNEIATTRAVDLGEGWIAKIRVSESVAGGIAADVVATEETAVAEAIALARDSRPLSPRPAPRETPSAPSIRPDAAHAEMTAPDLPHRLLALFRFWSVIDRFYPYKQLIGDWNGVLRELIPRFEGATDAAQYTRAVFELAARVEDGHTSVWGPASDWEVIGAHGLPIEVRSIEDRFIVTAKRTALPPDAPIAIGDEIVSIDGENIGDRVKRLWKYFTGSHEAARRENVIHHALRGPRRSIAEVGVRGPDGKTRIVTIARAAHSPVVNGAAIWRTLDCNIGYIDLTRLTISQIDEAFTALSGTKAIIFDMRGYPNGTGWPIASRINTKNATVGALFRRPEVSVSTFDQSRSSYSFEQLLPDSQEPKYTGRTVMLIDERTLSQAEQTGLWLEAASGTTFVGSNSAGANGDMTNLVLPGGIHVSFTGHEVRHADGRQLQRIGLVPEVVVRPSVSGIRQGRDEVLERAMAYLRCD